MKAPRGFTLIELMIVIAIIAIIAAVAIPSLLRARMAANSISAMASCKAYAEAQEVYRRTDYDGDGILEYAVRMGGAMSLLETAAGAGDLALIDRSFAAAEGDGATALAPRAGYLFTVLTSQGPVAVPPINYIVGGNMIGGFAFSAIPQTYDGTGRSCFKVNNNGTVYQADLGAIGSTTHPATFDPIAPAWGPAE